MIPSSILDRLLNIVLSPTLWLSVLLAFIYSTLFTLWRGGGWGQWLHDLAAGLVGFGAGQLLGRLAGLGWLRIGDVQLLWGSLGALAALFLGRRIGWSHRDDLSVP